MTDSTNDHSPGATGDYSATKAPENHKHVTSAEPVPDPRLKPGGARGVPADVGMSGLPQEPLPTVAENSDTRNDDDRVPERSRQGKR